MWGLKKNKFKNKDLRLTLRQQNKLKFSIELVKIQLELECGSAFHGSMGLCMRHTHPNQVDAKHFHAFPFFLGRIYSTTCDVHYKDDRFGRKIQRKLLGEFSYRWLHEPNCFPIQSLCRVSSDMIAFHRNCYLWRLFIVG